MNFQFFIRIFVIMNAAAFLANAFSVADKATVTLVDSDNENNDNITGDWPISENKILNEPVEQQFGEYGVPENFRSLQAKRMKSYMDMLTDPCEDFHQFACGNWEKIHPIREEHFEYNVFSVLQENLYESLRKLLLEPPSEEFVSKEEASAIDKAKYLFTSCMDDEAREKLGEKPLVDFLKQFGSWPATDSDWKKEQFDWITLSCQLTKYALNGIIRVAVDGDLKDSNRNIIYIDEPVLSWPRPEVYKMDSNSTNMLAYHQLITGIVQLLGVDEKIANTTAREIIEFEMQLAKIKSDPMDRKELDSLYNKMNVTTLISDYPEIDWLRYLSTIIGASITNSTEIILLSKDYMQQLPVLLAKTDGRILFNYMLWRYVKPFSEDLDKRFKEVGMKFSKVVTGQEDDQPKAKSCVHNTNIVLGMALGAMFVRRHFNESSKVDVINLTREIQQSFRDALHVNSWIDDETRKLAEEKVNKVTLRVGYPDEILLPDKLNEMYKGLILDPNNYFQNSINLGIFLTNQTLSQLNKSVDREEWGGLPAVINAYFEQSNNRIIIPAGVLQPPIYNKEFPRALNYAGIGNFVGHELTHGFDDTGRNFDLNGDMKQWWTKQSMDAFKIKGQCFEDQYNKFSLHGKSINGLISKGENIADNGGLRQAYQAYDKWLKENPDELTGENLPGLDMTGRKLFFLAFAQIWCGAIRPEAVDDKLETDAHSPGKYRVLGTLRNFEEFSKEFQCAEGIAMNPKEKCRLW